MNTPMFANVLSIAMPAIALVIATQATPALAASAADEVHFTRAGGPRVELRVAPVPRESPPMIASATRYVRG